MTEASELKLKMAKKEYYPDVTLTAGIFPRGGDFENMYSLTAQFNLPLWFKTRQNAGVQEANASILQAKNETEAARLMVVAVIRDNYSMIRSSEKLMGLYKEGLLPKTYQDFQSALSGYGTGSVEAIVAITRVKNLIEYENLYWNQFVEREKAIARLHGIVNQK